MSSELILACLPPNYWLHTMRCPLLVLRWQGKLDIQPVVEQAHSLEDFVKCSTERLILRCGDADVNWWNRMEMRRCLTFSSSKSLLTSKRTSRGWMSGCTAWRIGFCPGFSVGSRCKRLENNVLIRAEFLSSLTYLVQWCSVIRSPLVLAAIMASDNSWIANVKLAREALKKSDLSCSDKLALNVMHSD